MSATPRARTLTADAIVAAALEIGDREGLSALSMRRVAAALDTAAMSLYRHVAKKDVLLELMVDHVLAKLPMPDADEAWPAAAFRFHLAMYELLLQHPAVAHVMLERPIVAPNMSARAEALLAQMVDGGLGDATAVEALTAMTWHTLGGSLFAIARGQAEEDGAARFAQLAAGEHPTLARVARHFNGGGARKHFRHSLQHLINGYERGTA